MFAVVAIPRQDDYVWKISSEKIPHMTLLAFEDPGWTPEQMAKVVGYIQHAASLFTRFGMDVDRRGELGDKNADVLYFRKGWGTEEVKTFRSNLLADNNINAAVGSSDQFESWIPHLTLGFPATPAKPDKRDYPGTHWVDFDQVAFWTSNYEGPAFRLKSNDSFLSEVQMSDTDYAADILEHYGVKGMKWGVRRRNRQTSPDSADTTRVSALKSGAKTQKTTKHLSNAELKDAIERMRLEQEFSRISGGIDKTRTQKGVAFIRKLLSDTGKQTVSEAAKGEARSRVEKAVKAAAAAR